MLDIRILETDATIAIIDDAKYDQKHMKAFMLLIRQTFLKLEKKGVKYVQQTVLKSDWDNFLSNDKRWAFKYEDAFTHAFTIECKIDLVTDAIIAGLGCS
jgi:methionine synthase II (cobalamin-independent)